MNDQPPVNHPLYSSLAEIAIDMRSSWNHAADDVWRALDPELWQLTREPWSVLQSVSWDRIELVGKSTAFVKNVDSLVQARRQAVESPAWFQQHHAQAALTSIAYFCMEFMLSEALPIYSGGLGNVAGDQL
ncbi:MAG: DUF3417 domain-containing protein, partial [Nitrospirae bacterium]|nr:DUF3417 domain-containing protein [Nitrospirota bacterium]